MKQKPLSLSKKGPSLKGLQEQPSLSCAQGTIWDKRGSPFLILQLHLEKDWKCIELLDLVIRAFPYGIWIWAQIEGWDTHKKRKRVPYVCLFLFISSQLNRSTSSVAWLKLMLLKMSIRTQLIHSRTWHHREFDIALRTDLNMWNKWHV